MIVVIDILCLHQRIFLQRSTCLRDILVAPNVSQRYDFKLIAQNASNLVQLVLVICCEYYLHFSFISPLASSIFFSSFIFTLISSNPSP